MVGRSAGCDSSGSPFMSGRLSQLDRNPSPAARGPAIELANGFMPLTDRVTSADGTVIACRVEGTGPAVVMLHGFPDLALGWRRQSEALANGGFRAIAPDLRGYGESDRPVGIEHYALTRLADDIIAVCQQRAPEGAMLVGHDWGGVVAWYVAMQRPDLLRRLVILNAPHPAAYRREIARFSSQILRSWYAALFQLPRLPELLFRLANMHLLERVWRGGPARDSDTLEKYREQYSHPDAIRAALDYYRAAPRYPKPKGRRITAPVTILWGDRDRYLRSSLASNLDRWVTRCDVEHFPQAGHWLQHDEPEAVNARLVELAGEAVPR